MRYQKAEGRTGREDPSYLEEGKEGERFLISSFSHMMYQVFLKFTVEDEDFHPDLTPNLEAGQSFDLLKEFAGGSEEQTSYIIFTNFVRYEVIFSEHTKFG
jgi:hypothetical protein